jgi:hypothetical protein
MVLLVLSTALAAVAQNDLAHDDPSAVILILNNGSRIEGKIIHWELDSYIEIESTWGQKLRFYNNQVKKVIQKSALNSHNTNGLKLYNYKETGFYGSFKGQLITGNDGDRAKSVNGIGFSVSAGYKFHRLLALGGGIGWDQYVWDSGEQLIPVFAELSGYIQPKNASLFYNIQSGYSFAQQDDLYLLTDAKGGFMLYPSVGIRFGDGPMKYTLDVGYKFQDAEFTYSDPWVPDSKSIQDVKFKRLTLRFGILL